ncbi:MAG: hypothetical protein WBA35_12915, partial [Litorimonas sp.]
MRRLLPLSLTALLLLSACATTEPVPETVTVDIDPFETCTPISALTRKVIPEVTQTRIEIVEIDNPPYEPIQDRQT